MATRRLQVHTMEGRLLPGMVEEFLGHIAASLEAIAAGGPAAGRARAPAKPRGRLASSVRKSPALA
jgi:hypothetical protein